MESAARHRVDDARSLDVASVGEDRVTRVLRVMPSTSD